MIRSGEQSNDWLLSNRHLSFQIISTELFYRMIIMMRIIRKNRSAEQSDDQLLSNGHLSFQNSFARFFNRIHGRQLWTYLAHLPIFRTESSKNELFSCIFMLIGITSTKEVLDRIYAFWVGFGCKTESQPDFTP